MVLVDAHTGGPAGLLVVDVDLIGERIGGLGGNRRNMVFVSVGKGDDFHGGGEEGLLHCPADLGAFCITR